MTSNIFFDETIRASNDRRESKKTNHQKRNIDFENTYFRVARRFAQGEIHKNCRCTSKILQDSYSRTKTDFENNVKITNLDSQKHRETLFKHETSAEPTTKILDACYVLDTQPLSSKTR